MADGLITKFITPQKFPLVVEPANKGVTFQDFIGLLDEYHDFLKANMLKYGAILFRGFPVEGAKDFASVIKSMKTGSSLDYVGGDSPRNKITDGVYTSTEAPPNFKLSLHNELSYVKHYPTHIYFYCEIPPVADGETIIADARKVYQSVRESTKQRFIEKQLRYVSCYHNEGNFLSRLVKSHKSWTNVFETECIKEVERKCHENEIAFKWNKDNWLQISQIRPAILEHPQTKETVWFNQAHQYDFNPKMLGWWRYLAVKAVYCRPHTRLHEIYYGDNSKIARDDLYHVLDVLDDHTVAFPWQKGDVLALDNVLAMHGRNTFKGKRRILTSMTGKAGGK